MPPQPTQVDRPRWLQLYATWRGWSRNLHTWRHLARLDNHQLVDAGISHAQRQAELEKPFWR
nr:DUF1127 domain-containing protein [uncultured Pseudomonas sp.]